MYTLDGAVKVSGLSKSTILRALECGQISGTRDLFGEWRIEPRELCQISRPLAQNVDKNRASTSAVCNAPTLEAEIAALVQDAGLSLRGQLRGGQRDAEQVALQLPTADPSETDQCSASSPARLDRPPWEADLWISDVERISPPHAKGSRGALVNGAKLGTLGIGCILLGSVAYFFCYAGRWGEASALSTELKTPATIGSPETDQQATSGLPRTDQITALAARVAAQAARFSSTKTGKLQSEHKFSGLRSTADVGVRGWRFSCVPRGDITHCSNVKPKLLDRLRRRGRGAWRNVNAERLGHLQLDDELELGGKGRRIGVSTASAASRQSGNPAACSAPAQRSKSLLRRNGSSSGRSDRRSFGSSARTLAINRRPCSVRPASTSLAAAIRQAVR